MAPAVQGTPGQAHLGSGTTGLGTLPASIATGELLIASCYQRGAGSSVITSNDQGYTSISSRAQGTNCSLHALYKIAGASESAPTFTWGSSAVAKSITIFRISAFDSGDPLSDAISDDAANAATATPPSITIDHDDSLLLVLSGVNGATTFDAVTGMTEFYDESSATGSNRTVAGRYQTVAAGASGSRVVGVAAANSQVALMFAINPVPSGEPNMVGWLGN